MTVGGRYHLWLIINDTNFKHPGNNKWFQWLFVFFSNTVDWACFWDLKNLLLTVTPLSLIDFKRSKSTQTNYQQDFNFHYEPLE